MEGYDYPWTLPFLWASRVDGTCIRVIRRTSRSKIINAGDAAIPYVIFCVRLDLVDDKAVFVAVDHGILQYEMRAKSS
jgi:hypothetical protein